jgi:hypothetical protein
MQQSYSVIHGVSRTNSAVVTVEGVLPEGTPGLGDSVVMICNVL